MYSHQELAARGCLATALVPEPDFEVAAGLRGTGIGRDCDELLRVRFGPAASGCHSLYDFTLGLALDDPRFETEPAQAAARLRYLGQEDPAC